MPRPTAAALAPVDREVMTAAAAMAATALLRLGAMLILRCWVDAGGPAQRE